MEATVNQGIEYTYNQSELNEVINNTIDKIESVISENNYQVSGKIEYVDINFRNNSKNEMKKVQKYCYWIDKKPTLKRINTLFSLLSRDFGIKRVNVKVSLKEEKIQKARKEWLKAREESDKLLATYKKEKGDFYKKQLVN
jgi:hypothetical protein